jgi:t-SNARE complex subunit (syntaxin)
VLEKLDLSISLAFPQTAPKMDYGRLSQNVGSNIQKMKSQVSDVERMVRQIGTASDSPDLRERLHKQTHGIHDVAKQTGEDLKQIDTFPQSSDPIEQRQRKLLKEKLLNEFTDALKRFQQTQREAAKKERESVVRARAQSSAAQQWNPFEDEGQKPTQSAGAPFSQTQTTVQMEEEVDLQGLREREDAIKRLESDILDVNQIFKDLAVLVHEQGEIVDSIEANVEVAAGHVEQANTQLSQARNYQSKARRKMICIIGLLVVVALVLFLIIYFSVK